MKHERLILAGIYQILINQIRPMETRDDALETLKHYFKGHGVKECILLQIEDHGSCWWAECIKPDGLFVIDKMNGEIQDNYGVFEKQ